MKTKLNAIRITAKEYSMPCDNNAKIIITRGDDSDALGNTIKIHLNTELDLTDFTAVFQIDKLRWEYNDITSKELNIVITREQSMQLEDGVAYGALKIYDANDKAITIIRDVPIYVKTKVVDNE